MVRKPAKGAKQVIQHHVQGLSEYLGAGVPAGNLAISLQKCVCIITCDSAASKQHGLHHPDIVVAALLSCTAVLQQCWTRANRVGVLLYHPRLLLRVSLRSLGLFFQDGWSTEARPLSGVCHGTAAQYMVGKTHEFPVSSC
jgi:hypothetical protein